MADNQGSARVTLKEIDLSQVRDQEQLPVGVPAAVIGPAKRGPAFVPEVFASMQQFSDTFGSMSEVSKNSNSNLFGPLAMNEWMRNAQAGAYVRVLGVGSGDGTMSSSKRTTGAGFIVGENISYTNDSLVKNKYATITDASLVGATKAGRTHFLGAFMRDTADSTLLEDSGLQSLLVSSKLKITLTDAELPSNNDFILIQAVGSSDIKWIKFIFNTSNADIVPELLTASAGTESDPHEIVVGISGLNVDSFLNQLEKAFTGKDQSGVAVASDKINSDNYLTLVNKDLTDNFIEVSHEGTGLSTNTIVKFLINTSTPNSIKLSSLDNESLSSTDVSSEIAVTSYLDTAPVAEIQTLTVGGDPANGSTITITDILGNDAVITLDITDNDPPVQTAGNTNEVTIGIQASLDNNTAIAAKILEAINFVKVIGKANQVDGQEDPTYTVVDNVNGTLTITSSLKGLITNFIQIADTNNMLSLTASTTGAVGLSDDYFYIRFDIDDSLIGQEFQFDFLDATATNQSKKFKFISPQSPSQHGVLNGGYYQIEIDNTNQVETINGIQSVLNSHAKGDYLFYNWLDQIWDDVTPSQMRLRSKLDTSPSINFAQDSIVFKFKGKSISAVFQSSGIITNDAGVKSLQLVGGGGAAAPIIRGLLMTPQGVVPTLNVTDGTYKNYSTTTTDINKDVASGGDLISFGTTTASNLFGYELGKVDDNGFEVLLNGFNNDKQPIRLTCSFDPNSVNYFAKVLNTDPEKIEECGHYLYSHWDIDPKVAEISMIGKFDSSGVAATMESAAFCLPSKGDRNVEAAGKPNFEAFDSRFRTAYSPWMMSQKFGGQSKQLFKLHSLDDGAVGNDRFRILVSDLKLGKTASDWSTFTLALESFDSDPIDGETIIQWKNLTFDPNSRNFIGRVIGNKNVYYDFAKKKLVEEGEFEVRNKFVRIEMTDEMMSGDLDVTTLPCGFKGYRTLNTNISGLFDESGTDGSGASRLLSVNSLNGLEVLPLPLVKTLTRESGVTKEASTSLPWGVKFAKKENAGLHKELSEIRFNQSVKSWTKFYPDMGTDSFSKESTEEFSLENIVVADASNIDWSTSEYARSGSHGSKQNIVINSAASGLNVKYLKFRCLMQGGFDGLNILNKEKASLSSIAAYREANEEVSNVFTGPTVESLKKAIDVLSDTSATEIQLLAIPGIREPLITDYAITACESRFDAMLVMDIEEIAVSTPITDDSKPHVQRTINRFDGRQLDTSFAAAYFPDVISRRSSNNTPIQVPPSVCMLGVMSQNDTLADPWFAPAGLTRGRLNASNSKVQMSRDLLNNLYDADINPIYIPAGRDGEVYAFGQKTLLQNQSALDRINVRRLLINLRRKVKAVANTLLFEPNRASTLERFSSLVEPIMSEVQARQGVDRYKVQIDTSTTTQNDVENNTIRGKIYLQPTKSVEFISLDFVVTNSID